VWPSRISVKVPETTSTLEDDTNELDDIVEDEIEEELDRLVTDELEASVSDELETEESPSSVDVTEAPQDKSTSTKLRPRIVEISLNDIAIFLSKNQLESLTQRTEKP
jgi:hypothetical protein